jgi:hypothetical protein
MHCPNAQTVLKGSKNLCNNETACKKMIQPTIEELNSLSINQKAEKMLLVIGVTPDPQSLFCVQLALWAIEKALVEVDESVAETTSAMLAWKPVRIVNFFLTRESDVNSVFESCETTETPHELAYQVLEIIESRMMIHFPWYFSVE